MTPLLPRAAGPRKRRPFMVCGIAFGELPLRHAGRAGVEAADRPGELVAGGAAAVEQRAYDALPVEAAAMPRRHEAAGTPDAPEYLAAREIVDPRFVCRIDPWPAFPRRAIARANFAIAAMMEERDDRHGPGGRKNWDITAELGAIRLPTLVLGGRYDGLVWSQDERLRDRIPGAEWVRFEARSHYAPAEEPDLFLAVVDDFLTRVERAERRGAVSRV